LLAGHAMAQCTTRRKIAASILGGLIGVFIHLVLPAALGPLGEMSTRDISCERGQCVGLTTSLHLCADFIEIW
jgi:hypothetical protein